jgi:hypothetical protein
MKEVEVEMEVLYKMMFPQPSIVPIFTLLTFFFQFFAILGKTAPEQQQE